MYVATELSAGYQAAKGARIPITFWADHGQPGASASTFDPSGSPECYFIDRCLRRIPRLREKERDRERKGPLTTYHHISTISTHWFNDDYYTFRYRYVMDHPIWLFLVHLSPCSTCLPSQKCCISISSAFLDRIVRLDAKGLDWFNQRKELQSYPIPVFHSLLIVAYRIHCYIYIYIYIFTYQRDRCFIFFARLYDARSDHLEMFFFFFCVCVLFVSPSEIDRQKPGMMRRRRKRTDGNAKIYRCFLVSFAFVHWPRIGAQFLLSQIRFTTACQKCVVYIVSPPSLYLALFWRPTAESHSREKWKVYDSQKSRKFLRLCSSVRSHEKISNLPLVPYTHTYTHTYIYIYSLQKHDKPTTVFPKRTISFPPLYWSVFSHHALFFLCFFLFFCFGKKFSVNFIPPCLYSVPPPLSLPPPRYALLEPLFDRHLCTTWMLI